MPTKGSLPVKVYYEDTDSLGIVYYANYLRFFERGRSELFESLSGGTMREANARGLNFAVHRVTVTYHKPARLGDTLQIVTEVDAQSSEFRLRMLQRAMLDGVCLTDAQVDLVCLDESLQLRPVPTWVFAALGLTPP